MESLKILAKMDNFNSMMDFIQENSEKAGFEKKTVKKIRLACEEMIINIINYAYPDKEGNIEIVSDYLKNNNSLIIKIIDDGIPFNPLSSQEPDIDASIEDRKIGGLGIFLARKVMDKIDYKREKGQNILVLTKKVDSNI
jgi:serine/threonine-protein kinase RsbW